MTLAVEMSVEDGVATYSLSGSQDYPYAGGNVAPWDAAGDLPHVYFGLFDSTGCVVEFARFDPADPAAPAYPGVSGSVPVSGYAYGVLREAYPGTNPTPAVGWFAKVGWEFVGAPTAAIAGVELVEEPLGGWNVTVDLDGALWDWRYWFDGGYQASEMTSRLTIVDASGFRTSPDPIPLDLMPAANPADEALFSFPPAVGSDCNPPSTIPLDLVNYGSLPLHPQATRATITLSVYQRGEEDPYDPAEFTLLDEASVTVDVPIRVETGRTYARRIDEWVQDPILVDVDNGDGTFGGVRLWHPKTRVKRFVPAAEVSKSSGRWRRV